MSRQRFIQSGFPCPRGARDHRVAGHGRKRDADLFFFGHANPMYPGGADIRIQNGLAVGGQDVFDRHFNRLVHHRAFCSLDGFEAGQLVLDEVRDIGQLVGIAVEDLGGDFRMALGPRESHARRENLTGGLKPAQSGYQHGQLDGAHAREGDRRPESPQPDYIQASQAAHGKRGNGNTPPVRRPINNQPCGRYSPNDNSGRLLRWTEEVFELSCTHGFL